MAGPGERAAVHVLDVFRKADIPAHAHAVLGRQRPARDAFTGGDLELRVVPAAPQVVGADKADIFVAGLVHVFKDRVGSFVVGKRPGVLLIENEKTVRRLI